MADKDKPRYSDRPWLEEVLRADPEHYKKDIVYEWSNGRKMESTDGSSDSGIYD